MVEGQEQVVKVNLNSVHPDYVLNPSTRLSHSIPRSPLSCLVLFSIAGAFFMVGSLPFCTHTPSFLPLVFTHSTMKRNRNLHTHRAIVVLFVVLAVFGRCHHYRSRGSQRTGQRSCVDSERVLVQIQFMAGRDPRTEKSH